MLAKFTRGPCLKILVRCYIYECGSYVLTEVVARREYIARHVKNDSRDKWCKNEFRVQVNERADEFKCEYGMFEHFGMVCSHALKVSHSCCSVMHVK